MAEKDMVILRQMHVHGNFDPDPKRIEPMLLVLEKVEGKRATGVIAGGTTHTADAVVFNGDVSALGTSLLGQDAARAAQATPLGTRSLSAVTWTMVARPAGFPLLHHNVFFSDDYAEEFDAILRRGRVPDEPTVYVCAQDRRDVEVEASDERLLVLVNAPANGDDPDRWTESEKLRQAGFDTRHEQYKYLRREYHCAAKHSVFLTTLLRE
jgi:phytoene dehydrogenase-like protein